MQRFSRKFSLGETPYTQLRLRRASLRKPTKPGPPMRQRSPPPALLGDPTPPPPPEFAGEVATNLGTRFCP